MKFTTISHCIIWSPTLLNGSGLCSVLQYLRLYCCYFLVSKTKSSISRMFSRVLFQCSSLCSSTDLQDISVGPSLHGGIPALRICFMDSLTMDISTLWYTSCSRCSCVFIPITNIEKQAHPIYWLLPFLFGLSFADWWHTTLKEPAFL